MTPMRQALQGALFASLLSILIFFLKIICPLDTGCFVDPFLLVLFSPLPLLSNLFLISHISISYEPFVILLFWTVVGFISGLLASQIFPKDFFKQEIESREE